MDFFDKVLQPFFMVVVACPRRDMIRIWPLPVVDPWFEDWYENEEWYKNWWKYHELPKQAI